MRRLIHRTTSIWKREEGFSFLLGTLVCTLFLGPLLKEGFPVLAFASTALLVLLFVVGALVVSRTVWMALAVTLLAGSAIALEMAHQIGGGDRFAPWRFGAACLTIGLFTFVTLSRVFAPGSVTAHRLVGAVVAFLLVGLTWAYAYEWLETVRPGSFHVSGARQGDYATLLYYSFVTLTTVGYGDVTPLSSAARALSNVEALIGVLFPAVLIGRLLSMQVPGAPPKPPASD